jgi:TonB-linked SusC/RagA family outer membrane protein
MMKMRRQMINIKSRKGYNLIFNLSSLITIGAILWCNLAVGQNMPDSTVIKQHVKGVVTDVHTKSPVAAAQIQTLNSEAAATTNEDGSFDIEVTSATEVLLIKAFGYQLLEYPVRGRQNLEINLYSDNFTNNYLQVEDLTGQSRSSCSTRPIKAINDVESPTTISVDDMVQSQMGGDVRGLSRSGVSGIGSAIFIRGLNSLNLNSQPLYVVDGVIWNNYEDITSLHDGYFINSLANIDVNDIESVSVIKDGTSIYGSKGGNGVIHIKTKRGKDMVTKITVNALGGIVQQPASIPMMNGDQFKIYATDLYGSMGMSSDAISKIEFLNDDPSKSFYKKYHNNTDWNDEVYNLGKSQSYNISINGGDKRALYNFSLGYTSDKGVVKSTDMQRLNTRFNADFFLTNKMTMGLNVAFTNLERGLLDDGVNFSTSPTYQAMIKADFLTPYSYTSSGTLTNNYEDADIFNVGNPSAIIDNSIEVSTSKQLRFNIGIKPEFKITPSLTLNTRFDYNLFKVNEWYYRPMVGAADVYLNGVDTSENVIKKQLIGNNNFFSETHLEYKHKFGDNHRVNSILGLRYISNSYELEYAEGHNSGSDQVRSLNENQKFKKTDGLDNETRSLSYFANLDYSFDNRYFLTAIVSVDGSSRFGDDATGGINMFNHVWGVFPSINAGWLVSSERFMSGISFIDLLKLRASYGLSGNESFDPYAWSAYFSSVKYIDHAVGYDLVNIGNPEIQWETSAKLNFGVDVNFLNNRVAFSADVYKNKTSDLLHLSPVPEVFGSGYYWTNGGELSNKGFEISSLIKLVNQDNLKWEFGASVGHYKNQIESLPDGEIITSIDGADILTSEGNAAGVFYGYKSKGIFASQNVAGSANLKMIDADGNEHFFAAGDVYFDDKTPDGIINDKDKQIIGDPNPDIYGSFNNKIAYKNLTFNVLFTYSYGNDVYNYLRYNLESGSSLINQTTAMLNRWGYDGQVTNQPKASYNDPMGNARFSDRWIEDGSYLRLKSLSVNYQLPIKIPNIQGVNIWLSANNLWTLTNYLGRDPEVSSGNQVLYQGIDTGLLPVCRSFFVGIKLNL